MLSATREAFTLGRDGVWPAAFARLNRLRTPWVAILAIGLISALVAAIGLVDFLSYISSSGYLFVLFWGSLSLIRLRRSYPDLERPFKVPLFPMTVYVAGATCVLIIAFADPRALAFGVAVLALFTALHYIAPTITRTVGHRLQSIRPEHDRIVVAVANPKTTKSLTFVAAILAQATGDSYICVLTIDSSTPPQTAPATTKHTGSRAHEKHALLRQLVAQARARNVALYTKTRLAANTADGILEELADHSNTGLLLMGWPGSLGPAQLAENPVKQILQTAHTNVAVLLNRGLLLQPLRRILVPVGGGPHSRLAVRLAWALAGSEGARVTVLRILRESSRDQTEELEDQSSWLSEVIEEVLGEVPSNFALRVATAGSIEEGVLYEAGRQVYNLIVIGASEEWALVTRLFGAVDDWVADRAPCSVLLCRRWEPVAMSWLRRELRGLEQEHEHAIVGPSDPSRA